MLPRPRLSRTAQQTIRELRTDYGVEPTLDEILWLHELGKRVENPIAGENLDNQPVPVKAGNVYLWPFTAMSSMWFNERASKWFEDENYRFQTYALAFALAHGRGDSIPDRKKRGWFERLLRHVLDIHETETLRALTDRTDAYRCIKYWASGLNCNIRELEAAIDYLLPRKDQTDAEQEENLDVSPGIDLEQLISELAVKTGTDINMWLTGVSKSCLINAYLHAESIERSRSQTGSGPPIASPRIEAIKNIRIAVVEILKAHDAYKGKNHEKKA